MVNSESQLNMILKVSLDFECTVRNVSVILFKTLSIWKGHKGGVCKDRCVCALMYVCNKETAKAQHIVTHLDLEKIRKNLFVMLYLRSPSGQIFHYCNNTNLRACFI